MAGASKLTGTERAAVLLMTLGERDAAEVLKHMGPKEVQKIGSSMASMSNVSKTQVGEVLEDFMLTVEGQTALGVGSEDYIRKVMIEALGEDKAGSMVDRILMGRSSKGLEALKWMDPRAVAEIIKLEHPQIIAIVLSYLDADQSADILMNLPERTRPDLMMRISSLDAVQPAALKELDEILEKQFSGAANVASSNVGGIKAAAEILNFMESSSESEILDQIREADPDMSQKIQDNMFVFDNLLEIDDRGVQMLLREISSESLIVALKGADESMREKFFKNMSKRASEMMRDDLEARGPVKLSEVEQAQKEILAIARRLADSGELSLGGKGGEQYV